MVRIQQSDAFDRWLRGLGDARAKARILARIDRMADGHLGDAQPIGSGLSEARIHYGPGYRIYFMQRGAQLIILLCGGDKCNQSKDIKLAKRIATDWLEANP